MYEFSNSKVALFKFKLSFCPGSYYHHKLSLTLKGDLMLLHPLVCRVVQLFSHCMLCVWTCSFLTGCRIFHCPSYILQILSKILFQSMPAILQFFHLILLLFVYANISEGHYCHSMGFC